MLLYTKLKEAARIRAKQTSSLACLYSTMPKNQQNSRENSALLSIKPISWLSSFTLFTQEQDAPEGQIMKL